MDTVKSELLAACKRFLAATDLEQAHHARVAMIAAVEHAEQSRTEDETRLFDFIKSERSCDGDIEFDDDAIVSLSDDGGAYVQAWLWIDDPEASDPDDIEHCDRCTVALEEGQIGLCDGCQSIDDPEDQ